LEWRVVGPTLYRYLSRLDIPVELYAPYGTPHEELQPEFLQQEASDALRSEPMPDPQYIQPAWVALVEILHRLDEQPYHWPTGRTTFQKIAYVATEEGLPTDLEYRKSSFGPFSPDMKRWISKLLNNSLIQEEQRGRMFVVRVGPTFRDAQRAYQQDLQKWESLIARITDLFMRLNTRQAEIVATVLFAERTLRREGHPVPTEREVLDYVLQWKQRRRPPLEEWEIADAIRNLAALGWLQVSPSPDLPLSEEALAEV
jgi:uncharacterized protein YwgA